MRMTSGMCVVVLLATLIVARDARAGGCVPGAQTECACADGKRSVQVCAATGDRLEPCQCGQTPPPPVAPAPANQDGVLPEPEPVAQPEPAVEPAPPPFNASADAIDPRAFANWARIPAYQPDDDEDEEANGVGPGLVIAGSVAIGVSIIGFVVGGVARAAAPRSLRCDDGCAAYVEPGDEEAPNVVLGVSGALAATGLVLLPIGLARTFGTRKKDSSDVTTSRLLPSRVHLSPGGGRISWNF